MLLEEPTHIRGDARYCGSHHLREAATWTSTWVHEAGDLLTSSLQGGGWGFRPSGLVEFRVNRLRWTQLFPGVLFTRVRCNPTHPESHVIVSLFSERHAWKYGIHPHFRKLVFEIMEMDLLSIHRENYAFGIITRGWQFIS